MRNLIFILILIVASINSFSQDVVGGRIIAKESFFLRSAWADSLKNDTLNLNGNVRALMTANAIYDFVNGRMGGGAPGSGTVTSISQGYGILNTPNPITTTGSIVLDSATVFPQIRATTNNFANANLTQTATRTYAGAGFNYSLNNLGSWTFNMANGKEFLINNAIDFYASLSEANWAINGNNGAADGNYIQGNYIPGLLPNTVDIYAGYSSTRNTLISISPDSLDINLGGNGSLNVDSLRNGSTFSVNKLVGWRDNNGVVGYVTPDYGLTMASALLKVDSFSIATRARVQKGIDSVAALSGATYIFNESVIESNDSVFLDGEKIYTPGANKVYGGNNAGNMGFHDAAIINTTNVENGHFLNYRNGEWVNTKYFQEMKFRTGDTGYPAVGDSLFTDTAFVYSKLNVFREGELQYEGDTVYGYEQNTTSGQLTFHPPLFTGERIIVQVYDTLQWQTITHELAEVCVDFVTAGDLTESPACTWSSAAGTGKGYSTTSLQIGDNGTYTVDIVGATENQAPIGLDDDASNTEDYTNWECTIYRNGAIYTYIENGGTATSTGVAAADGDILRFDVTSGVIKAQKSSDGGSIWTDLHTYSGVTQDHILYAKTHLVVAGRDIVNARVFNFQ